MKFKTAYSVATKVVKDINSKDMTYQSFKEQCDVNNILKKYQSGQILSHVKDPGTFKDCTLVEDYMEAVHLVMEAEASFDALPAKVKKAFDNSPQVFLAWMQTATREQLAEHGLLKAETPTSDPEEGGKKGGDAVDP